MYQGLDECPTPADNQAQVSAIVSAMNQCQEDVDPHYCPDTMIYLMEHKYCEASLSFQLKNGNQAVAEVLTQAKAKVDFHFMWDTSSLLSTGQQIIMVAAILRQ